MIALYVMIAIGSIAVLSSIVPILQYFYMRRQARHKYTFYFSEELLADEMKDLVFEHLDIIGNSKNSRLHVVDRGWIRCPLGKVMDADEFNAKKEAEYLFDLP